MKINQVEKEISKIIKDKQKSIKMAEEIYKTKVSNEDYENIIKIFAVNETSGREN